MRPKNDVRYREVYTAKNPLHRGCVMRSWPSFYPFLRKVSAIKDISYKKVSLYSWSVTYSKLIAIYLFIFLTCLFTSYARTIHEKKIWTLEKKNMTHKMPTRKKFKASKYSPKKKKKSDPRNTHEKKFRTGEIPTRQKFRAHKILKRKNFGPTKARWHETHGI